MMKRSYLFLGRLLLGLILGLVFFGSVLGGLVLLVLLSAERNPVENRKREREWLHPRFSNARQNLNENEKYKRLVNTISTFANTLNIVSSCTTRSDACIGPYMVDL